MSAGVHHSAICARDVDASLRFYRDGLGLTVFMDREFDGAWDALFGAPSRRLRSIFLGDPAMPESGIVELVRFDGDELPAAAALSTAAEPRAGFFLLSFFVGDVEASLARLEALGLGGEPRRIEVPGPDGPVAMATVHDPDGVLVEVIGR
jgi:glyoxylase I family protein